jgi:uncharacterized transporter YbjL
MKWLFDTLRSNPEIAIFLALALGFYIGGLKFGKFSLGNVTGVLLAGVLIGQFLLHGRRPFVGVQPYRTAAQKAELNHG